MGCSIFRRKKGHELWAKLYIVSKFIFKTHREHQNQEQPFPKNTKNTGSKKWKQISKKISNFSFPDLKNEEVYVHWGGGGQGGVGGSKHPNPAVKHQAPDLTTQGNKVSDAFSQRHTGSEKTVKCYKSLLTKHLSVHSK